MSIYVTKSFMPPVEEYERYIEKIFNGGMLTNQGPLLQELERKLSDYLNVKYFQYVSNGTIALQLALKSLGIERGEIITTPFSYVATTSSILWERCTPVFADIEPDRFTIDPSKIEAAITPNTRAIMPVHVFGYACDVEAIEEIAKRHNLFVIYDAAHAFGTRYKGKSLVSYGDVATLSFHATKLFHTVEGGGIIAKELRTAKKLDLIKRFGHYGDEHHCLGINGKQSEFHAAMGLANFPYISEIIAQRKRVSDLYDTLLAGKVGRPKPQEGLEYNYAYYPVVFGNEDQLLRVFATLNERDIFPRRYFYPSLNQLPYVNYKACPISENITSRIACLPLSPYLTEMEVKRISKIINETV